MDDNKDDHGHNEREDKIFKNSFSISFFSLIALSVLLAFFFNNPVLVKILGGKIELGGSLLSGRSINLPFWVSAISTLLMLATVIFLFVTMIQDIVSDPEARGGLKGFMFFICSFPLVGFLVNHWFGFIISSLVAFLIGLIAGLIWRKSDLMHTACTVTGSLFAFGASIIYGLGPASVMLFLVYFLLSLMAKTLKSK